jgi:hypothetical protein
MKQQKTKPVRKPNKAHLRKWVKALRSGKFQQGSFQLYEPIGDTYCCLGVAEHVRAGKPVTGLVLSPEGSEFYGIAQNPKLLTKQHGEKQAAAALNDNFGWSFERIAKAIERTFNL